MPPNVSYRGGSDKKNKKRKRKEKTVFFKVPFQKVKTTTMVF
jgi:hypothetical protein